MQTRVQNGVKLRWQIVSALGVPAGAVAVALGAYALFVALAGANPAAVFAEMYRGAFGSWFSLGNTLQRAAPIMLTALCTALPARLGLVVIGGEGALVLGGLAAATAALPLAAAGAGAALVLMALAAMLAGALWIGLAAALRVRRGVNETIGTLLLNYVAIALFHHLVEGPLRDPASLNKPSTRPIGEGFTLGPIPGLEMDVHWGLGYGVAACLLAWVLMERSTFGFAARVVGGNVQAARLVGLPVGRLVVGAAALGGAAAGLAGMAEVAAVHGTANATLVAGYGYSGILVAFLARHNPLAIVPVALLLGGVEASGGLLQRTFGLPDANVRVLEGILFLVLLASESLRGRPLFPSTRSPAPAVVAAVPEGAS